MSNGLVVVVSGMLQGKTFRNYISGADPGFQVRGGALKNYLGVFRVKNHDFTQKNHIFSNLGGAPPPPPPPLDPPLYITSICCFVWQSKYPTYIVLCLCFVCIRLVAYVASFSGLFNFDPPSLFSDVYFRS